LPISGLDDALCSAKAAAPALAQPLNHKELFVLPATQPQRTLFPPCHSTTKNSFSSLPMQPLNHKELFFLPATQPQRTLFRPCHSTTKNSFSSLPMTKLESGMSCHFFYHIKSYMRRSPLKHSSKRRWLDLSVFHQALQSKTQPSGGEGGCFVIELVLACDFFRSSIDGFKCDML
jgi:hypothetical protein